MLSGTVWFRERMAERAGEGCPGLPGGTLTPPRRVSHSKAVKCIVRPQERLGPYAVIVVTRRVLSAEVPSKK